MANSSCLWTKARENLPADVKEWLASLEQGIQPSATATEQIDALIEQTTTKEKDFEKSNHRFRKYFDKIIHWLDTVKGIGDVISSFDPVHAALPWAAFRFALQAILAEREQAESVLELLASTPHLVLSGRVLEMVYTRESMHIAETEDNVKLSQQCHNTLQEELIKLYSELLGALKYCYSISSKHKIQRKATAIFNSSEVVSIHQDLEVQHRKVIACGENCHKILNHTLSRKSLDMLQKIQPTLTEIGDRVQDLLVRIDESERRKTLEAISSILFRAHHDEVSRRRTAGTCEWILKRKTFIRWEESDSSVTILYGSPGAGKTFLVSRVVDHSIERAKAGEAVAFFYCKRDEENRRNPQDILRSILRQLSSPVKETHRGLIHVAVKHLPNKLALQGTTFDIPICESLIGKLTKDYPRTTIILDALDECDRSTREDLMRVLSNLTNQCSKVRVFISSRYDDDILRHFRGTPVMTIQATDNQEDVSSFVEDRLCRDSRWRYLRPELQEEIKGVFHERGLGMFQWAALQVDQIRRLKLWTERSIKEQMEIFPTGLMGAYDIVWKQLQEMSLYEEQLARRAFQWVLCAFRPLRTPELSLMMQIDPDSDSTEIRSYFSPETIQSICGNLLVYDLHSLVWRFSHLSAREYIEKHHYSIPESHQHVAISSLKFLKRDLLWLPLDTKSLTANPLRSVVHPWYDPHGPRVECTKASYYMIKQVFWHIHEIDLPKYKQAELGRLLEGFFEPVSQGSLSFQAWKHVYLILMGRRNVTEMQNYSIGRKGSALVQNSSTPLQVMSIYGLFHILRDLWEKAINELNVLPTPDPSPLSLAIMCGHEPIWRFLLAKAKVSSGTPRPLTVAIQEDYREAFDALIQAKAAVNDIDPCRKYPLQGVNYDQLTPVTPLSCALWYSKGRNRRHFLRVLLDAGADINLETQFGTLLEVSVQYFDEKDVEIVLDANTVVYNPDHLLRVAAWNQRFNLAPMLVKLGANIEVPWKGVLPTVWALCYGNLPNVLSFLEISGTALGLFLQCHRAAILSALEMYEWSICPIHTILGSFFNDIDRMFVDRAIFLTFLSGYSLKDSVCSDVYPCMFDLESKEAARRLQRASSKAFLKAVVKVLVSVDFGFGSALAEAAFYGRLHHCRALLDHLGFSATQEHKGFFRSSLFAVMSGHLSFLSWEPDDHNWWRPLGAAVCRPRHLDVLQSLFERGMDIYMPIYGSLELFIPVVQINFEGYELTTICRLYQKGYSVCFSRIWFFIMWDLQNGTSKQSYLCSQLRRWQFPGTLPLRFTIVAKLMGLSRAPQTYFIALSVRGHRSQFIIVPAQGDVRGTWSRVSQARRWRRYEPESFGATRFPDPNDGPESSSTEVPAAFGKFEVHLDSSSRNIVAFLLAFMIGLLSGFVVLLLSTYQDS